jgi:hypothetical protein
MYDSAGAQRGPLTGERNSAAGTGVRPAFLRQPADRVLRFLDEDTTVRDELA